MLEVCQAAKAFKGREIFSEFNFTVDQGCFHAMVGPSGCGKSTLLDGLTGTIPLDHGKISWNHTPFQDLSGQAAYMHQKDLLLPWFSLADNVLLPAKACSNDLEKARTQARHLMIRMGLENYSALLPSQVSGGMRQRCALARTLMFNRDLILLDEPLSALDTITRQRLQSYLLLLQTEFRKTILMITHDIDEALLLSDRLYLLSKKPMKVIGQYVLDIPKPRKFSDPELMEIKEDLLKQLESDGVDE